MDPVYDHVYNDGDPIQDSAGVMKDFSWQRGVVEKRVAPYIVHSTTTDLSRRSRGTNRTLDPLKRLPPELSTFVITQALPPPDITASPSMYPSRLIELTTVSRKWQSFLFSTPVLWSGFIIDGTQEDFLATLSVFIRLSSDAPVKLFFGGSSTGIDWTGLTSILLPSAERVTCLSFGPSCYWDFGTVPIALSNLLERLCRLPRLEEVNFLIGIGRTNLLRIKAFGLPSTVKLNGVFQTDLPESCWGRGIQSRLFDVTKCKPLGTLGQLVRPSQPNLLVGYPNYSGDARILSNGSTLCELETLAECLAQCNCFEQLVYTATFSLRHLESDVDLSQTEDLLGCLRMLVHLQALKLRIRWGDRKITRDHTLSNTTSRDLKRFDVELAGGVENLVAAQKPLCDLFLALEILYPGVEEVSLRGSTCISLETSYLQSLRALKSLVLDFEGSPLAVPSGTITLQSLQRLEMQRVAQFNNLHASNLLSLSLHLGRDVSKLDDLGPFPQGLRSLAITENHDMKDFNLTSLDCPDLRNLYLASYVPRASWGRLWLPNLVSIQVGFPLKGFTDPSSNQLCITLLCYPRRLPSLRELHFAKCVEWDILFLMLKRRNCDESGVQRIDTVTLPFIPFAFQQLLTRLLAGEIVELPSLISLSLEETREVIFDPSVPGCFACMKNMRPGCTASPDGNQYIVPVDILYPPEDAVLEETPQEIQGWLSQRRELVEMWKASYEEFAGGYSRLDGCEGWSDKFS